MMLGIPPGSGFVRGPCEVLGPLSGWTGGKGRIFQRIQTDGGRLKSSRAQTVGYSGQSR